MKKTLLLAVGILLTITVAAPCAMAQPVTLRYADHNPEAGEAAQRATLPLLQKMQAATNDAVQLETYFGETRVKAADAWEALRRGADIDMAWLALAYWPGKVPLTDAFGLPGLAYNTPAEYAGAMWKAYEKYPEMQYEYRKGGIKPLIFFASEPYLLATSQKEVKTLEDLKDLKIRTLNGAATTQMKALGAMPVALPMPEVYSALQNAEVEGVASPAEAICVWKLYENLKYVTNAPLPASYFTLAVNERYWNRLPAEIKEQLMSAGGYAGSQWYAEQYFGYFNETLPEIAAKNGHKLEIYTLTDDERAEWIAASAPVFDEYYNYAAKKGITAIAKSLAQELLDGSL